MENISINLDNIQVIKKTNPNFLNAEEISKTYNINKFRVLKMAKDFGPEWVYRCFLETEKSDFCNKPALFIKKVYSVKLITTHDTQPNN